MRIKRVIAKAVKDSRGEKTIQVIVKTGFFKKFKTSSPSGKSTGKYEIKSYVNSLEEDINFINGLSVEKLNELNLERFEDLIRIEELVSRNIGGNSLFALESSLLKALAGERKQELYEFLGLGKKLPRPVGNAIGGGLHSTGENGTKPDFQEFLFIANGKTIKECIQINREAYEVAKTILKAKKRNDEGAWETGLSNEGVLTSMRAVQEWLKKQNKEVKIGIDVAASSFFKNKYYEYNNPKKGYSKTQQINYINNLIKKYSLYYVEDGLEENDFEGFEELTGAFIVGDDLTTTNPSRLEQAIKNKSINAIIVKPNQIGSLLKVKEVIDIAKRNNIKTIISHRSGETKDDTIADLAVSWDCDFIKTGIYGKVRESKLNRLVWIEKRLKR